ncbi:MAG: hypothetical protein IPP17_08420 [Bacteroidetes bacterium]|nr:hypothetical protein [Bacteroidota bacterium]
METEKRQLNKSQGSHEKPASDIWASAFDVAQCVGEDPPPFQLKATTQLKPEEEGETFPYKGYVGKMLGAAAFIQLRTKEPRRMTFPRAPNWKSWVGKVDG